MNGSILAGGIVLLIMWGVWGIIAKIAVKEVGMQVTIWSQVASLAMLPLYFFMFSDMLPIKLSGAGIAWAIVAGVLGTAGSIILYVLLRSAPASIVVPISALYPVVTVILSILFLNEALSLTRVLGVACAVIAIWLLAA